MKKKTFPAGLSKEDKLKLIYRHTHRDYRGTIPGTKTILVLRGGTHLVPISELTDAEIADKLPYALKKEEDRLELAKRGAAFEKLSPAFRAALKKIAKLTYSKVLDDIYPIYKRYSDNLGDMSFLFDEFIRATKPKFDPDGFISAEAMEEITTEFYANLNA